MTPKKISFNYQLDNRTLHYSCDSLRNLKKSISKNNILAPKIETKIINPRYHGTIFINQPQTVGELIYAIEHHSKRVKDDLREYSKNNYTRIGIYSFDEVFPYLVDVDETENTTKLFKNEKVFMNNAKYHVFKNNPQCVCCGLRGQYLALEQCKWKDEESRFHFNMYGIINGEEILFTKDHILPKSKGGTNTLDNYQTMCNMCNSEKGNSNISLESLRRKVLHKRQRAIATQHATRHVS